MFKKNKAKEKVKKEDKAAAKAKEATTLHFNPPDKCSACGKSDKNIRKNHGGWLGILTGDQSIRLYSCPCCNAVFMNKDARANVNKVDDLAKKEAEKRIITAN